MRTLGCFILALGLAAVLASPSLAQQPRQGRGGFGFGTGQGGVGALIRMEAVQKELKMEKDQTDKATEAVKKVQDKHADEYTKLRDLSQEERRTKTTELTKVVNDETYAALETVLKPEQTKRLKELELQRAGVAAFTRADVQTALSLNDEQKGKVKAISEESATKLRELMGGGRGQGGQRPMRGAGARPDQAKITELRKEYMDKAVAVLNDDQKKTWTSLVGTAFTFPPPAPPKKDN
jgi:delta 1-pyrroline-5-carboxylate dehydrogenase